MVGIWVEGNVGNSEGRGIGRVGKSAMIDTSEPVIPLCPPTSHAPHHSCEQGGCSTRRNLRCVSRLCETVCLRFEGNADRQGHRAPTRRLRAALQYAHARPNQSEICSWDGGADRGADRFGDQGQATESGKETEKGYGARFWPKLTMPAHRTLTSRT